MATVLEDIDFVIRRFPDRPLMAPLFLSLSLALLLLLPLSSLHGQERVADPVQTAEREARLAETRRQLVELHQSMVDVRARIELLRQELEHAEAVDADEERETIQEQLEQLETQRRNLRQTFENIALGGLDMGVFTDAPEHEEFNWQDELLSIMRPLFSEMRQLTERPRAIERLRRDRAILGQRLNVAEQALNNIQAIPVVDLDEAALTRLQELEENWRERREDLLRQRSIVQLQIDNLLERDESVYDQANRAVREFFVGRGLTLILAIGALALTLLILQGGMNRLQHYRERKGIPRRGTKTRVFLLTYRVLAALLSILVFLMVLYAAGDLVLFGLAMLVLIALLLSFRTYLPRYVAEAKLFLNVGQVRERERLIYNGIPWRVSAIGWYTRLVNPELDNGVLRLPLSELADMISRPIPHDEPWFPCRPGEYVLLGDGTFGLVERQTPEIVQLRVLNNSVLYATTDFLAARPRNLSRGSYLAIVTFGIDYRHQSISTADVPPIFKQAVIDKLAEQPFAEHVEDVLVEFKEAAGSSLDYLIIATINGAAAPYYFKVGRVIQTACVEVCNARDWVIPFNQLTIHQGEGFEALTTHPDAMSDR